MTQMLTSQEKRNLIARRVAEDPYAPTYHFMAPEGNAMPFDPNGALFWKGKYHLFYIFQDPNLPFGGHCWGHASSKDLLHWTFHPTALAPAPGDPDKGIFSGNAFISKQGVPTIAYYGIDAGICLAQSTDDALITWTKLHDNPVIPEPREGDPGWGVYNVFDPHIWLEGETYYAILGGNVKPDEIRDTAYVFKSEDLHHWTYMHPFYTPHPEWTDPVEDCACPDFFKLGNRYVLSCISHAYGARYYLGRYQDGLFTPEEHHRMNWAGGPCFAPETLDSQVLLNYFDPARYLVKITPLNPTHHAVGNGLTSYIDPQKLPESETSEAVQSLRQAGYQVIVSIGEVEENAIGSNCGQYVLRHIQAQEALQDAYSYSLQNYGE